MARTDAHVGGIEGVDSGIVGCFDMLHTFFCWQYPRLPVRIAVRHTAQDDLGYLQARVAEADYNVGV